MLACCRFGTWFVTASFVALMCQFAHYMLLCPMPNTPIGGPALQLQASSARGKVWGCHATLMHSVLESVGRCQAAAYTPKKCVCSPDRLPSFGTWDFESLRRQTPPRTRAVKLRNRAKFKRLHLRELFRAVFWLFFGTLRFLGFCSL